MSRFPRLLLRKIRAAACSVVETLDALVAPPVRLIPIPIRVRQRRERR